MYICTAYQVNSFLEVEFLHICCDVGEKNMGFFRGQASDRAGVGIACFRSIPGILPRN